MIRALVLCLLLGAGPTDAGQIPNAKALLGYFGPSNRDPFQNPDSDPDQHKPFDPLNIPNGFRLR
ncbi:MAG: hypothetical protein O3A92_16080 [Verrucomicrobia bacterium]|nr:hypothetical protein [Verrucomicrobiota bacterium]